ncbi:MAG TPA: FecR domain-containing protein [Chitinophaga sp.]|nr:FecR domain-containing protein [Chitinophaga sp.]
MEQQDIDLLIIRHFNHQTTRDEEFFLAAWLDLSEANRLQYAVLEEIWVASRQQPDEALLSNRLEQVKQTISRRHRIISMRWRAVAAAVTVGIIITSAFLFRGPAHSVAYTERRSAPGQVLQLQLADGTQVHLAPSSTIRYREDFGKEDRNIFLEGEALFEVAKNAHQPFSVQAGGMKVHVLGTKFNVTHYKGETQTAVSLLEGRIQVALPAQSPYDLQPGEQLRYDSLTKEVTQGSYDPETVTGWTSRLLVFRNETLAVVALKIEKMYNVKISFSTPDIAGYKLFARFKDKPLRYVLDVIRATDNLDYTIEGNNVRFTGTGTNTRHSR